LKEKRWRKRASRQRIPSVIAERSLYQHKQTAETLSKARKHKQWRNENSNEEKKLAAAAAKRCGISISEKNLMKSQWQAK